jgi:hypothetical protein
MASRTCCCSAVTIAATLVFSSSTTAGKEILCAHKKKILILYLTLCSKAACSRANLAGVLERGIDFQLVVFVNGLAGRRFLQNLPTKRNKLDQESVPYDEIYYYLFY